MMWLVLLPLLLQVLYASQAESEGDVYCKKIGVPDFYWREYNGAVPFDAIEGGTDKLGRPTFIGQASIFKIGNLPATIYHGNSTAIASSGTTIYADRNVKVLCSGSPQKFKWIPTDTDNMSLITNCSVVPGGVDYEDDVYIARVQHEGEVKIGKVLKRWNGMFIPDKEKETLLKNFELLVFGCKEQDVTQHARPNSTVT